MAFVFVMCFSFLFAIPNVAAAPAPAQTVTFTVGKGGHPYDLDPHNAWDSGSNDILNQIFETLVSVDYDNPSGGYVAKLATKYEVVNDTAYDFTLREGVKFHDGTDWNAAAAKWNLDRMVKLTETGESQLGHGFWAFEVDAFKEAGVTGIDWCANGTSIMIWNNTQVLDTYKIRIELNFPFAPFLDLLCYIGTGMISPTAHAGNKDALWDTTQTNLVGTGPFNFTSYSQTDNTAKFTGNDEYWNGAPYIDELVYSYIDDSDARMNALLSGDVDFVPDPLPEYMDQFKASVDIDVKEGPENLVIQYLGLNTKNINKTTRQAVTYAFNYSYVIDEIMEGYASRLTGPIPKGMKYYNSELTYPTYDVAKARQILIDGGIAPAEASSWTDDQWKNRADTAPLDSFNYTYNTDNKVRTQIYTLLKDNCRMIGVNVTDAGMDWGSYLTRAFGHHDWLESYYLGWGPDFNNPVTYTLPLWDPNSFAASHQLDNPRVTKLIYDAILESDETKIQAYYDELTDTIVNDEAPWVFVYQGYNLDAWRKEWAGCEGNFMADLQIYPIHKAGEAWTPGQSTNIQKVVPTTIPGFPIAIMGIFSAIALLGIVVVMRKKVRK
jgi:ABC-type transport system substrate-binding protein